MTSDTRPKEIAVEFKFGGQNGSTRRHVQGRGNDPAGHEPSGSSACALHATMLCFLTTDAAIEAKTLQAALNEAVAKKFSKPHHRRWRHEHQRHRAWAGQWPRRESASHRPFAGLPVFQARWIM